MAIKSWTDFKNGGFIFLSYILLQSLGKNSAIVLCEIMSEYNHAVDKKLNIEQRFLVNLQRMSDYLNLDFEDITSALNDLKSIDLIEYCFAGIENTIFVLVKEDNIINFKLQQEQENLFHGWNFGLVNTQNPRNTKTSFNKSTNVLIKFVNENMKNPEIIPMSVFVQCNLIFENYGIDFDCLYNKMYIYEDVFNCINNEDFEPIQLVILVQDLCKEYKKGE